MQPTIVSYRHFRTTYWSHLEGSMDPNSITIFIKNFYFFCRLVCKVVCVMSHFALVEWMATILIPHTSVSDPLNALVVLWKLYMAALLDSYIMVICVCLLMQWPVKLLRALLWPFKCQHPIPVWISLMAPTLLHWMMTVAATSCVKQAKTLQHFDVLSDFATMADAVQMQQKHPVYRTVYIVLMGFIQIWQADAETIFTVWGVGWHNARPVLKAHCTMGTCVFLLSYLPVPWPL